MIQLLFHIGMHADSPKFEHDQSSLAASTLMRCARIEGGTQQNIMVSFQYSGFPDNAACLILGNANNLLI